jgi:hypothetical protein
MATRIIAYEKYKVLYIVRWFTAHNDYLIICANFFNARWPPSMTSYLCPYYIVNLMLWWFVLVFTTLLAFAFTTFLI